MQQTQFIRFGDRLERAVLELEGDRQVLSLFFDRPGADDNPALIIKGQSNSLLSVDLGDFIGQTVREYRDSDKEWCISFVNDDFLGGRK